MTRGPLSNAKTIPKSKREEKAQAQIQRKEKALAQILNLSLVPNLMLKQCPKEEQA
jgi:hypothetical protein